MIGANITTSAELRRRKTPFWVNVYRGTRRAPAIYGAQYPERALAALATGIRLPLYRIKVIPK